MTCLSRETVVRRGFFIVLSFLCPCTAGWDCLGLVEA